jgi:hypothetical protein
VYDYLYKALAGITVTSRLSYVENCQHIDILHQSVLSIVDNFVLYIWYLIFIIQQDGFRFSCDSIHCSLVLLKTVCTL